MRLVREITLLIHESDTIPADELKHLSLRDLICAHENEFHILVDMVFDADELEAEVFIDIQTPSTFKTDETGE